ncbi:MAG TPA: ECF-type sigma factor [Bryobacteraceae bacterium]|nr:ECF-type sigma factor [Bryobacteraceae bacterium]
MSTERTSEAIDQQAITQLLRKLGGGEKEVFDQLVPLVYDQLRRLASRCMQAERPNHTLRATALVHEAYLRMAGSGGEWRDRIHFYAVAARVMRHILVDYARAGKRQKRGDGFGRVALDEAVLVSSDSSADLSALDESLRRLAAHDERKSQVIELLFFGGLTYQEAAAALGISEATLHRDLRMAKAWVHRDMTSRPD